MAVVMSIVNRKGGVGKSTISAHLAAGMATLGLNVAMVDTDSQGHASLMLSMEEENGLFAALVDKKPLQEVVRHVPPQNYSTADRPSEGNLYLLPSSALTYRIPYMLDPDDSFLFLEKMQEMSDLFALDVIVIDTAPTLGLLDGSIYLATDAYLYVTECERLSLDGIVKAVEQMQRAAKQRKQHLGRESRVVGIIPNKLRANTRNHRHNIRRLGEAFPGMVWSPVILGTIWTECTSVGELVFTYAPTGQEAVDAWRIVNRTVETVKSWQATTAQN